MPPSQRGSEADVDADMRDDGNQWNVDKATKYQLKLGLGAWVSPNNLPAPQSQIDKALSQARDAAIRYGTRVEVDLVIGSEVNRQDVAVYSPTEILSAMQYAKNATPDIPRSRRG